MIQYNYNSEVIMKEEIKEVDNKELISIYRLLLEQKEYLENIKIKMEDEQNEK